MSDDADKIVNQFEQQTDAAPVDEQKVQEIEKKVEDMMENPDLEPTKKVDDVDAIEEKVEVIAGS